MLHLRTPTCVRAATPIQKSLDIETAERAKGYSIYRPSSSGANLAASLSVAPLATLTKTLGSSERAYTELI
jgi:hypothetical protein